MYPPLVYCVAGTGSMSTECRGRQCWIPAWRPASDTATTTTHLQLRLGGRHQWCILIKVMLVLFITMSSSTRMNKVKGLNPRVSARLVEAAPAPSSGLQDVVRIQYLLHLRTERLLEKGSSVEDPRKPAARKSGSLLALLHPRFPAMTHGRETCSLSNRTPPADHLLQLHRL